MQTLTALVHVHLIAGEHDNVAAALDVRHIARRLESASTSHQPSLNSVLTSSSAVLVHLPSTLFQTPAPAVVAMTTPSPHPTALTLSLDEVSFISPTRRPRLSYSHTTGRLSAHKYVWPAGDMEVRGSAPFGNRVGNWSSVEGPTLGRVVSDKEAGCTRSVVLIVLGDVSRNAMRNQSR